MRWVGKVLETRACAMCRQAFTITTVTPKERRKTRRFCSDDCAKKFYRAQQQARILEEIADLRAAGKTGPEIYMAIYTKGYQAGWRVGTRARRNAA